MKKFKVFISSQALRTHRLGRWCAALALLCFGLSGLSHTLMTWSTPQAAVFFPPSMPMTPLGIGNIPRILQQAGIQKAVYIKIVPFEGRAALQVTEEALKARRYFDLESQAEVPEGDLRYARWLASYYFKSPESKIVKSEFQTEFDKNYPWVNRLLPIYKVHLESGVVAYIHTETSSLVTVGTDFKTFQQNLFLNLHSFEWLEKVFWLRFVIMVVLVGSLFAMSLSGLVLLWQLNHRRKMEPQRRWHRLVAYIVVLPLIGFTLSGLGRLLMNQLGSPSRGALLREPFDLDYSKMTELKSDFHVHTPLSSISLVSNQHEYYFRLAKAGGKQEEHVHVDKKFSGMPGERGDRILKLSGESAAVTDADLARSELQRIFPQAHILSEKIVQSYGPYYDFRNKRLPVWQFELDSSTGPELVFVDPATGVMVDQLRGVDKAEALLFGVFHKWNVVVPWIGRTTRDILIFLTLVCSLVMMFFGVRLAIKRKKEQP